MKEKAWDEIDHELLEKKGWLCPRPAVSQADGDDGNQAPTRLEPYPLMTSVEQDEAIALLGGVVAGLDRRVAELEKK